MKREHLLWILTTAAGAAPILEFGQGSQFDLPGLRFGVDRKFKISVFEDLHFGEPASSRGRPDADNKTVGVMNAILDKEPINLAVLNGDLVSCEFMSPDNLNNTIDQIVAPFLNRNIPWASTYGNHDMSKTCSTRIMSEHQKSVGGKLSWSTSSVPGDSSQVGTSNYYIPIYSSSGGGNPNLAMMLWFFDSRGGRLYQKTTPDGKDVSAEDWVDQSVINWFNLEKAAIKNSIGRSVPSLAFVHIPVHATRSFQQKVLVNENTEPGINKEAIGHQGNSCSNGNNCYYGGRDTPFMKALVETEGLMAVFSGHDHGVDWCMKWSANKPLPENTPPTGNGIHLCFGRHTGYGGYGDWTRGARQIVVYEDDLGKNEVETWIRLEDGNISGHVTLNSTYGTDKYPAVQATKTTGEVEGEAVGDSQHARRSPDRSEVPVSV